MVSSVRSLFFLLLLLANSARAELHFNLRVQETELDGIKLRQLAFSDGGKLVTYGPPRGWQYFGEDDRLRLLPPAGQPGEALIIRTKLPQPQAFDEPTMKRLTAEVVASIPTSAKRVMIISQQKNPLLIERKETYLVIVNFESYGILQARSVLFLNRGGEQLQFQLTCPLTNFPELQKQFFGSQFSWQNL
jgi:hypothetical protein